MGAACTDNKGATHRSASAKGPSLLFRSTVLEQQSLKQPVRSSNLMVNSVTLLTLRLLIQQTRMLLMNTFLHT